jgi:hypothetical protein
MGVEGISSSNTGVYALSDIGPGLHAVSNSDIGAILENTSGVAVQVRGHIQVEGDCIGQVLLRGSVTAVNVLSSAVNPNSIILLTPLDPCFGVLYISSRRTGSFTINASVTPVNNITIAYLIVN